jgi:hypothetical protein
MNAQPIRRVDLLLAALILALAVLAHGWITRPQPSRFVPVQLGAGPPAVLDTRTGRVCLSLHRSKVADAVLRCWPGWEYTPPPDSGGEQGDTGAARQLAP